MIGALVGAGLALAMSMASPESATDDEVFAAGVQALADERPNDAIGDFEILADRGRVDPAVSYDRGLAYAARVRAGAEVAGDLGKAAHGFEEAIALTDDPALAADAARALEQVRTEVGRRRAREGTAVELDTRRPIWRSVAHALPENGWSGLALAASVLLAVALFVRWRSTTAGEGSAIARARAAANVAIGALVPALVLTAALSATARTDRQGLAEAIVISPSARLSDARGIALAGATPLPEGARVELMGAGGTLTQVRAGGTEAWLPTAALRPIARKP